MGTVIRSSETVLATINQIHPVYVRFSIPERYLGALRTYAAGGSIRVRAGTGMEGAGGGDRTGRLVFIDNTVDVQSGTIQLKAEFPNRDSHFWPGQFIACSLELTRQTAAVVIPRRAVQLGDKGTFIYVVKADQTAELRPVVVDRSAGEEAVIAKGVAPGEKVITDGHLKVWPGAKVAIRGSLGDAAPAPGGKPAEGSKK
jgi:multidrug efflux system membrane fusion protein